MRNWYVRKRLGSDPAAFVGHVVKFPKNYTIWISLKLYMHSSSAAQLRWIVLRFPLAGRWCHHKPFGYVHRGRKEGAEKRGEEFPRCFPKDWGFSVRMNSFLGCGINWRDLQPSMLDQTGAVVQSLMMASSHYIFYMMENLLISRYFICP